MRQILLLLSACCVASADANWWYLENRPYYDLNPAEPHGAQTTVLFPAVSSTFPFVVKDGKRLAWNIDLGREIPIFGFETKAGGDDTSVAPGAFGLGVWFPLSFHMIEDMGKDPSNPILDTDYRFSIMVKGQAGLSDGKWGAESSALGFRFQFGHESTHIGDEFTVNAIKFHPATFQRVNVSFEYWDLGGSYEPTYSGQNHVKLRAGIIGLKDGNKGWYATELLYPSLGTIAASHRNIEPYIQAEWWKEPSGDKKLGPFASLDLRNRTVFNYAKTSASVPEDTQWSVNLMVGVRQKPIGTGLGRVRPSYFFRYYHGVNPAGQFRNQRDYSLAGFGVNFGF